jgi:DNA-binding transcriptional regulator YiaG
MTSQELREVRLKMGLTISQMAEALNTPRGTYVKWERGERRVPGILEVALPARPE